VSAPASEMLSSAAAARSAARSILAESRFHQASVPRPLHGVLVALGHALESPVRVLNALVVQIGKVFPGGVAGVWAIFGVLLLIVGGVAATRLARQRLEPSTRLTPATGSPSAAALERLAAAAQDAGDLKGAVRLRFLAGLARLSDGDAVGAALTRPTVDISRALGSSAFDVLACRFDEIAYGSQPATFDDIDQQRRHWPEILRAGRSYRTSE